MSHHVLTDYYVNTGLQAGLKHVAPKARTLTRVSLCSSAATFFKASEKKSFMREHTSHDEPISVKLFFLVLLSKEGSGDAGVCGCEDQ